MDIGKVKTPNKFEYAETDIQNYLGRNLGEPTVGITTHSVRWKIDVRPESRPTWNLSWT